MYGTLQPLARRRGGRPARVFGRLWENGFYPALLLGDSDDPMVAGVVFEVTEADLAELDRREGTAAHWYRRVHSRTVEGEEVWVYEADRCLREGERIGEQWRPIAAGDDGSIKWKPRHTGK